jgi:glycerol uptake facilitator-like aquaporin
MSAPFRKQPDLARRLTAEALGTGLLVATVIGSGIMAAKLAGGNVAVALLGNTIPTGAILVVLITVLGPLSGAHFNPAVTLVMALRRSFPLKELLPYVAAQVAGGIAGAVLANAMFNLAPVQIAATVRAGPGQWLSETIATFALMGAIFGGLRFAPAAVPWLVGLTITAAYWFTASTSFANPAVTIARIFSDTFAGIAPESALLFVPAQIAGALLGLAVWGWLFREEDPA